MFFFIHFFPIPVKRFQVFERFCAVRPPVVKKMFFLKVYKNEGGDSRLKIFEIQNVFFILKKK